MPQLVGRNMFRISMFALISETRNCLYFINCIIIVIVVRYVILKPWRGLLSSDFLCRVAAGEKRVYAKPDQIELTPSQITE